MKQLKKYLKNKRIAIVGNAQSIFEGNNNIDDNDIVIRMNRGLPTLKNYNVIGQKTNILALSMINEYTKIASRGVNIDYVLYCTLKNREGAKKVYPEDRLIFYPHSNWNELYEVVNARPSTGLMVVDFISKNFHFKEINIYGFDFMKTPTWYNKLKHIGKHNYCNEEKFIRNLTNKYNNIKIIK